MKHIIILILFPLLSFAQTDKVAVMVDGLGCPFCAFGLEKKMKKIDNINKFTIDMETGLTEFMVEVDKLVNEGGYTAMEITINRADGETENQSLLIPKAEDANTEISFHVNGSCGMCKTRIERATYRSGGVQKAEWNKKKKILTVFYNDQMTDQRKLESAIASIGYDTENLKAEDELYERLPECCQYKRAKK